MPTWWRKPSSKNVKRKPSKENFFQTLHRFLSTSEQKGITRLRGSRRRCNDTVSERGSRSRAVSRSPSSNNVSRCQSFSDRLHAQPLPLPQLRTSTTARAHSGITVSRSTLEKCEKPPLGSPCPTYDHITSRTDAAYIDGDLATGSVSSNCSSDTDDPADSHLQCPAGNDLEDASKTVGLKPSSLLNKEQMSVATRKESRGTVKPANLLYNNQTLSTSPKHRLWINSNSQASRHGAFASAPDSSMSSPCRSPLRLVFPEQIPSSAFWAAKPYPDINILGSGQCSSPGSGQTSGHNSMGGDMSGQLFWQPSRASPECSPIPSPRMTSPGPSSRIQSGAVTPLHPRAGGTAPESPTGRTDDGMKQSHRLPLPPITVSNTSPFLASNTALSNNLIPRSPGRPDNPTSPGSRWKKGKLIGRGTFGHVYVGFNSESGEMCAMKEVTLFDDAKSRESAKQLGQEVALLSRLRHQNIVQYYGSETIDDILYIYLEYVSGGSIHKLLQEYGQFGEHVIRSYTSQILSGLAYLHAKNTVHRDVKGANILVDPNGRVKLADFGMAKHITGQSCPLSFKGSPYWMAPEVIKNTNGCNLAVDIWSLGCTVLEMATSKPPWSQYEGIAAMFKIGNSKELPAIPNNLSADGKDFIRQCLQREPSNRPTAAALLQHPFVRNAAPVERSFLGYDRSEPAGDSTKIISSLRHARNLSSLDMEGLTLQRLKVAKASSTSSDGYTRNISCPVSPIGSPLLHSKSPKQMNGRISPSPMSSPKTTSGSSTPPTGSYGATLSKQLMQLADIQEGYGNISRSSNKLFVHGSIHHDKKHNIYNETQAGFPVFHEYLTSETDKQRVPFVRPTLGDVHNDGLSVLDDTVSQKMKDNIKMNLSLNLVPGPPSNGWRNGI